MVAAHGAKFAQRYIGTMGHSLQFINYALLAIVVHPKESLNGIAQKIALQLESVNRQVFIDTYTNYYYSKKIQNEGDVSSYLDKDVYQSLVQMHRSKFMNEEQKRNLFLLSFYSEQKTFRIKTKEFTTPLSLTI